MTTFDLTNSMAVAIDNRQNISASSILPRISTCLLISVPFLIFSRYHFWTSQAWVCAMRLKRCRDYWSVIRGNINSLDALDATFVIISHGSFVIVL